MLHQLADRSLGRAKRIPALHALLLLLALDGAALCQEGLDAVFINFGVDRICVGDGSGQFPTCEDTLLESSAFAAAPGFVDGDDKLDLIVVNSLHSNQVCLGDGRGGFFPCTDVDADNSGNVSNVALGFIDEDTYLDAIFTRTNQLRNRVCLGNGDGSFRACSEISDDEHFTLSVALGLLDDDEHLDAVFANTPVRNEVCLGNGDGTFRPCSDVAPGFNPSAAVKLGLVNADPHLDAIFANFDAGTGSQRNRICLGTGEGGFSSCEDINAEENSSIALALGFVNGDSHLDVVFGNASGQRSRLCLGNGDGTFRPCSDVSPNNTSLTVGVALGFVDGDGFLDVVLAHNSRTVPNQVCLGDGTGSYADCFNIAADVNPSAGVILGEFAEASIFADGFESADTSAWSVAVP